MPSNPTRPLQGLKENGTDGDDDALERCLRDVGARARLARAGRLSREAETDCQVLAPLLVALGWDLTESPSALSYAPPGPGAQAARWLLVVDGRVSLAGFVRRGAERLATEGEAATLLDALRRHRVPSGLVVSDIEAIAIRQHGIATPVSRTSLIHVVLDACQPRAAARALRMLARKRFDLLRAPASGESDAAEDSEFGATGDTDVGLSARIVDSLRADNAADEARERVLIGSRLRQCREQAGLDRVDVAARVGRGVESIAAWEDGRDMPSYRYFLKLAQAFGVDLDDLLQGIEI